MEDKVMKRLMVLLAIICSSAHIFASELVVRGNIDVPFSIFINGEKYYSYNNKVTVSNLPSGRYDLEIYTEGRDYELLYDYAINIPSRSTVFATFNGENKMYISTEKDAPAIIVDLTPYPRRVVHHYAPAPKPVVHHYAPAPKPVVHRPAPAPKPAVHHSAPAPKPAVHHSAPAPKSAPKPTPKAAPNDKKPSANTGRTTTGPKKTATRSTPETRR